MYIYISARFEYTNEKITLSVSIDSLIASFMFSTSDPWGCSFRRYIHVYFDVPKKSLRMTDSPTFITFFSS